MEPTLDNAMIFGGIGNLRLAPHVREGRSVSDVDALRSSEGNSERMPSAVPAAPSRSRGFVAGEKVSISAAAHEAFADDGPVEAMAQPTAQPDAQPRAPEDSVASPAARAGSGVVPAAVATAYESAAGPQDAERSPVTPTRTNALFA